MNKKRADLIFKVNDIRAVYGEELREKEAYEVGNAFAIFIKSDSIIVGRDMRESSPSLVKHFIEGVTDAGVNVIDIGLTDSPGLYFATSHLNLPGAMITASHNPSKYNGIKLCKAKAVSVGSINGLNTIQKTCISEKFVKSKKKGQVTKKDISEDYVKYIISFVNSSELKKLNAVFDAGNGMGGYIASKVYNKLPIKMTSIYFELDGRFPHHDANPAQHKNLVELQSKVRELKADFGVAFDGDADRVGFIDEKGNIIGNSIAAAIIFDNYFRYKTNKITVCSSTSSKIFDETVKNAGGKVFRDKVGHTFIKKSMKAHGAAFGYEESGHFYYEENDYADSAIITSVLMYYILSKTGKKLSDLAKSYEKYSKAEEVSLKVKDREKIIKEIEKEYKKFKPKSIERYDGTIINFQNYWFSVKPSNTEPLLRVNIEADNDEILKKETKNLLEFIKSKDN